MLGRSPRPVRLYAALVAAILAVVWLFHYSGSALALASQYVRALGPTKLDFKAETLTLQRAMLRTADVLPVYGTSELYCCAGSFNAGTFFQDAPTGFSVFNVGYPLTEDLFWAETFGALGNDLRGHKVVVSDSPWFTSPTGISTSAYAHTYSPEVAAVFTFDAPEPLALRAAVARRMVDFPSTLTGQPVVRAALLDLSRGGIWGYGAYLLLDPVGRLIAWTDELDDARETIATLHSLTHPKGKKAQPLSALVPVTPRSIPWNAELQLATEQAQSATASNPFGVASSQWTHCDDLGPVSGDLCKKALQLYTTGRNNHWGQIDPVPHTWVSQVDECACWTDLNLAFETLRAVGAKPLAWLQPLQGALDDDTPYSAAARRVLYDRYLAIAQADGIPATTFEQQDTDPLFENSFGHFSQRGWVYADRLLDLFWHNDLSAVAPHLGTEATGALFAPSLNCPNPAWCQGVDNVPPLAGELRDLPTGMPPLWWSS